MTISNMTKARGDTILHTSIAIAIVVTLAVILRFLSRKKIKARLATDDWLMLASLLPTYAMLGIASIS